MRRCAICSAVLTRYRRKTCGPACGDTWRRTQRSRSSPRRCEICGDEYQKTYHEQRTCGRVCGWKLRHDTWPSCRVYPVACKVCGQTFVARSHKVRVCSDACRSDNRKLLARQWAEQNPDKITESGALRRARKRNVTTERISIARICERDKWRCHICGERVDNRLGYPHPYSRSIDHVIPLAIGGEHTYANLRLAHLRCNVAKGARGGGEQLQLIG